MAPAQTSKRETDGTFHKREQKPRQLPLGRDNDILTIPLVQMTVPPETSVPMPLPASLTVFPLCISQHCQIVLNMTDTFSSPQLPPSCSRISTHQLLWLPPGWTLSAWSGLAQQASMTSRSSLSRVATEQIKHPTLLSPSPSFQTFLPSTEISILPSVLNRDWAIQLRLGQVLGLHWRISLIQSHFPRSLLSSYGDRC